MTNMISRRLIAGLALATLSLSFAPAQADTLDNIKKAGKVRIAIDTAKYREGSSVPTQVNSSRQEGNDPAGGRPQLRIGGTTDDWRRGCT